MIMCHRQVHCAKLEYVLTFPLSSFSSWSTVSNEQASRPSHPQCGIPVGNVCSWLGPFKMNSCIGSTYNKSARFLEQSFFYFSWAIRKVVCPNSCCWVQDGEVLNATSSSNEFCNLLCCIWPMKLSNHRHAVCTLALLTKHYVLAAASSISSTLENSAYSNQPIHKSSTTNR